MNLFCLSFQLLQTEEISIPSTFGKIPFTHQPSLQVQVCHSEGEDKGFSR